MGPHSKSPSKLHSPAHRLMCKVLRSTLWSCGDSFASETMQNRAAERIVRSCNDWAVWSTIAVVTRKWPFLASPAWTLRGEGSGRDTQERHGRLLGTTLQWTRRRRFALLGGIDCAISRRHEVIGSKSAAREWRERSSSI